MIMNLVHAAKSAGSIPPREILFDLGQKLVRFELFFKENGKIYKKKKSPRDLK